jgi:hypothetical protein
MNKKGSKEWKQERCKKYPHLTNGQYKKIKDAIHSFNDRCYGDNPISITYKQKNGIGVKVHPDLLASKYGGIRGKAVEIVANSHLGYTIPQDYKYYSLDRVDEYGDYELSNLKWENMPNQVMKQKKGRVSGAIGLAVDNRSGAWQCQIGLGEMRTKALGLEQIATKRSPSRFYTTKAVRTKFMLTAHSLSHAAYTKDCMNLVIFGPGVASVFEANNCDPISDEEKKEIEKRVFNYLFKKGVPLDRFPQEWYK